MGNKNNYGNTGFMQAGFQPNGCDHDCDHCGDVNPAIPCSACHYSSEPAASTCDCGCDNGVVYTGGCAPKGKWGKKHGDEHCKCDINSADATHVFFESCDGAKEICVTGHCQEENAPGRTLDVNCTLQNVCPGRRSALGITLTEMDEDGAEYARGFRAVTVPAHNARCNQDVNVDTVRFILPEDLSLQERRHFVVRTQHHYLDASSIWNNSWGK